MLIEQFTYKIPNQGLKLVLVLYIIDMLYCIIIINNNLYNIFRLDLMT